MNKDENHVNEKMDDESNNNNNISTTLPPNNDNNEIKKKKNDPEIEKMIKNKTKKMLTDGIIDEAEYNLILKSHNIFIEQTKEWEILKKEENNDINNIKKEKKKSRKTPTLMTESMTKLGINDYNDNNYHQSTSFPITTEGESIVVPIPLDDNVDYEVQKGGSLSVLGSLIDDDSHKNGVITVPVPMPSSGKSKKKKKKIKTRKKSSSMQMDPKKRDQAIKQIEKKIKKQEDIKRSKLERKSLLIETNSRIWEETVFTDWNTMKDSRVLKKLCEEGIPSRIRARAWPLLIGNQLQITPDLYEIFAEKARIMIENYFNKEEILINNNEIDIDINDNNNNIENNNNDNNDMKNNNIENNNIENNNLENNNNDNEILKNSKVDKIEGDNEYGNSVHSKELLDIRISDMSLDSNNNRRYSTDSNKRSSSTTSFSLEPLGKENSLSLIEVDLPRTFPKLGFFHDGGEIANGLKEVLMAYACYRPDVGYVQGMSYLAAMLLLNMSTYETFLCLTNMLNRNFSFSLYRLNSLEITRHIKVFDILFKETFPLLFNHFQSEGITSDMFFLDWSLTLFCRCLPLDIASRVWDLLLLQGEVICYRVGLTIMKVYGARLSKMHLETILPFLKQLPESLNEEEFFLALKSIKLKSSKLQSLFSQIDREFESNTKLKDFKKRNCKLS